MRVHKFVQLLKNMRRLLRYVVSRLQYATVKKLWNFCVVEFELLTKKKFVASYPYEAMVDLTNLCNLKCPLCATGSNLNKYKQGIMPPELYAKVCDQLSPYVFNMILYNWGEAFLLKNLPDYLKIAHDRRMGLTISSNLSVDIEDNVIEGVVKHKLDTLIVSCEGTTQEVYEIYRKNGKLEKVMNNVRRIREMKERHKSRYPRIVWSYLKMRHNVHQMQEAERTYKERGFDALEFGTVDLPFEVKDPKLAEQYFTDEELAERKSYNILASDLKPPCWFLWRAIIVNWDGTVAPCCYVNCDDYQLGDFKNHSLSEIRNSPTYAGSRALFRGEKFEDRTVCKSCPVYTGERRPEST